jgi:hypothetical protein
MVSGERRHSIGLEEFKGIALFFRRTLALPANLGVSF